MSEETPKAPARTRKPAAKKPPTKAAALKALGLEQSDLDAVATAKDTQAQLNELRQVVWSLQNQHQPLAEAPTGPTVQAPKPPPMEIPGADFVTTNPTEQINAVVPGDVQTTEGVDYKSGYDTPVEHSEQAVDLATIQNPAGTTKYWVRNCYGARFSLRLERQQDSHTRTELEPRGMRGDMAPLKPEDLQDGYLARNVNVGAVEILTHQEAMRIQTGQLTNVDTQKLHTPSSILVNAKGEAISGNVNVMPEYGSQGEVVGYVAQTETRSGTQTTDITRPGGPQQGPRSVNGETRQAYVPQAPGPDQSAALADQIARDAKARAQQGESGPGLALPGMAITQGEPVRT